MRSWQRVLVIMMLGSFPLAVYLFSYAAGAPGVKLSKTPPLAAESGPKKQKQEGPKVNEVRLDELNRSIEHTAQEIQAINDQILESNVRILEAKDDIARFQDNKKLVINDLEAFQAKLSMMISEIRSHEKMAQ